MKSRVTIAKEKHRNGYNCCQAVVCTYCDLLGMNETLAFRASEAYGLGIAKRYETCGSVCAMMMLAGLKNSDAHLKQPGSKLSTFDLGHKMAEQFEKWNTTCTCAILRGSDGITDRIRSCRGCVSDCGRIVEDICFQENLNHMNLDKIMKSNDFNKRNI